MSAEPVVEAMQKRIYGVETEYGIIFTPEGRKTLPVEKAIRFLFEKLITTEHFLNVFLENGARFYQDTGCHPEYATPECAAPKQLVVYDKAGERILEDLQLYAEEKIREERIPGKLSIFKNNTDFVGNSYGCHENYLVDRDVDFYYLAEQLIPFLVTRQIYTGAGKVFQTQDGIHYCVSQRAQHIYQKISGTTTNDRSIICRTMEQVPTLMKLVYSLMLESPTITCRRLYFSRSAWGSSRVLMIERSFVVVPEIFW